MKSIRLMGLGAAVLLAGACGRDQAPSDAASRDLQLAPPAQAAYASPQELGYSGQAGQPPAGYYYPAPQPQPARAPVYRAPARTARTSAGTTRTATAGRRVTHSRRDAAIGAGVGAITGAIIGRNVKGALIGAGVGGVAGAVVGATVDVTHER